MAENNVTETQPAEVLRQKSAELLEQYRAREAYLEAELVFVKSQIQIMTASVQFEPMNGQLSPREHEVLNLCAQGATTKEISKTVGISETTTKAHMRSILEKLHAKNRAQAVAKYQRAAFVMLGSQASQNG